MAFSPLCKICNAESSIKQEIERMYNSLGYRQIVEAVKSKYPGLRVSRDNLSTHRKHITDPKSNQPTTTTPDQSNYSFEEIDATDDPDTRTVIRFKIKELWKLQKTRRLLPDEEQRLRSYLESDMRAEDLHIQAQNTSHVSKATEDYALKVLREIEAKNYGDKNGAEDKIESSTEENTGRTTE